jgi:hypothetical protein
MITITNLQRSPLQLMVRSNKKTRDFNTKVLPGLGRGMNTCKLPEERITDQIRRLEKDGFLTLKETTD